MIKKEELMIGDWVYNTHNCKAEQVQEIRERMVMLDYNDLYEYDEIEPIPLTAEILEQCGFTTKDEPGHWTGYRSYELRDKDKKCLFVMRLYEKDVKCEISLNSCPWWIVFRNLHELQHPLHDLGIELELKTKEGGV